MERGTPKWKCYRCDDCFQYFNRPSKLKNHRKKVKLKCEHCGKFFCNRELLEKVVGVSELKDLNQKIQPSTGYGDAGIQAVLLGKLHEITS